MKRRLPDVTEPFRKNLAAILKRRKLSPADAEFLIGMSDNHFGRILSGKYQSVSLEVLVRIADGLDLSMDDLIPRDEIAAQIDREKKKLRGKR